MPAASKDDDQLRRVRSTTLSSLKTTQNGAPAVQGNTGQPRGSGRGAVQQEESGSPEPKTPTGNPAVIPVAPASHIVTLKDPRKLAQPPANPRRASGAGPSRPVNPNPNHPVAARPTAPLNLPASMESSVVSGARSVRRAEEGQSDNNNGIGLGRPRGSTLTPARVHSMFIPSPQSRSSQLSDALDAPILDFPHPPEHSPSAPLRASLPRQASYPYTNTVPWSSRGSLHSESSQFSQDMNSALQFMADPNLPPSATGSVWGGEGTVTSFGMETEIMENEDIDEDMMIAMDGIQEAHSKKILHYKRLLEKAHSNSASQLHSLQAELKLLKTTLDRERAVAHQAELARDRDRLAQKTKIRTNEPSLNLASTLYGDGNGAFNEIEVRHAIRGLPMFERMRLIGIILDCCIPGDISEQIRLLEKYRRSTFDIITNLPSDVGILILRFLSVPELLGVEPVSKRWQELVHQPALWRYHCLVLTATDPVPLSPPRNPEDWEPLYRSLHHRESNWKNALPQHIRFLNGHTKFCTTLLLKDKRLISGSYDETIRIWDIESGDEKKCLNVGKAVSCIEAEGEVLAVGFHDIGRVHLFSSLTFEPLQQLQGHLYGIKAIALNSTYLVSAGADKALVCWRWRSGEKIVRFGQQTNVNIGVQILSAGSVNRAGETEGERFASVTIDGIVRVFSIQRREMILQFSLSHLGSGNPALAARISHVGDVNNMLQWFAADGNQMTCATKSIIVHLEWSDESDATQSSNSPPGLTASSLSSPTNSSGPRTPQSSAPPVTLVRTKTNPLNVSTGSGAGAVGTPKRPGPVPRLALPPSSSPRTPNMASGNTGTPRKVTNPVIKASLPRVIAVVETPVDISVGAVDPRKRRVVTSTRFSARTGADRRIFVSTHQDKGRTLPAAIDDITSPVETPTATSGTTAPSAWSSSLAAAVATSDTEERTPANQQTHSRRSSVGTSYSGQTNSSSMPESQRRQLRQNYPVDFSTNVEAMGGVWDALATLDETAVNPAALARSVEGVDGNVPKAFKGLATHDMNPMSFALSHERVVVGCSDGTIYVMNFVGYKYSRPLEDSLLLPSNGLDGDDDTPPASVSARDEVAYPDVIGA